MGERSYNGDVFICDSMRQFFEIYSNFGEDDIEFLADNYEYIIMKLKEQKQANLDKEISDKKRVQAAIEKLRRKV